MRIRDQLGDWKEKIFREVYGGERPADIPIPPDFEESIMYVLSTIPETNKNFILLRYRQGKTLKECGESIGVTGERARQIIARSFRLLRNPYRKDIIIYGFSAYKKQEEEIVEKAQIIKAKSEAMKNKIRDTPIIYIDMSVRAYNCLLRGGIYTVGDISDYIAKNGSLKSIRNLGQKTETEIMGSILKLALMMEGNDAE